MSTPLHREIDPAIHYWGTPVVLVGTLNPDGAVNVAPMSSAWWLGWSCMLGLAASSQTVANLKRERECVLNLASAADAPIVNALALTTGSPAVPLHKKMLGYRYEADKVGHADLTLLPSSEVAVARIGQCRVHLEAVVSAIRPFAVGDPRMAVPACSVEVRIVKVHVDEELLGAPDRIDPDRWLPLIMSFRSLYSRGGRAGESRLASAPTVTEAIYSAGYSTSSRFYDGAGRELGMAPRVAKRGGIGCDVSFTTRSTSLGVVGIAWTERGVCDVFFVDDAHAVEAGVKSRWPRAVRARAVLPVWIESIVDAVDRPVVVDVPLDIQGTAFRERVWQALRSIPPGETRSYSDVAATIGQPAAHRAVAHAISRNPIAVLVPCHRVVAKDGSLSGYRWGTARKGELLRRETKSGSGNDSP